MKRALILGGGGQDGLLLRDLLEGMSYEVHSVVRKHSALTAPLERIYLGDVTNQQALLDLLTEVRPAEVYNLAAESSVAASWERPEETLETNVLGALALLEAFRRSPLTDEARLYHASSSEMFGRPAVWPQNEDTKFAPVSPYAISKVAAHHLVTTYRLAYGIHASCGILYNHESHLRPARFVTRKITRGAAEISLGRRKRLQLGSVDVHRDWGFAGDYVRAMWAMLQADEPDDYVVATGVSRSLAEFLDVAFACAGLADWRDYVDVEPSLYRPIEVEHIVGDASRARQKLGWQPQVSFEEMISRMVSHDINALA